LLPVGRSAVSSHNLYVGSAYDNYGGQTDYYTQQKSYADFNEGPVKEVEIKPGNPFLEIKWKK
jgi:hypothetical protein